MAGRVTRGGRCATSEPGGRGRSTSAFTGPTSSSLSATVATQANSVDHRRRSAITTVTAIRTGHSTAVPKPTLAPCRP